MNSQQLNIEALFSQVGQPSYPFYDDRDQLCWIEALTDQGGRLALKQKSHRGERIITPRDYQIRSRVHEYGGQCFCQVNGQIYFNNYADGLIYSQSLHTDASPTQLSADFKPVSAYADLYYAQKLDLLIAVQEQRGEQGQENRSRIVAFELSRAGIQSPRVLVEGADFYANPCVSPNGKTLSWIQWSHPHMPWDESSLCSCRISVNHDGVSAGAPQFIVGGSKRSVCQLGYLSDGKLLFAMDSEARSNSPKNYWNLYHVVEDEVRPVTQIPAELGEAHWIFGQRRWIQRDAHTVIAIKTENETDQLLQIRLDTGQVETLGDQYARLSQLSIANQRVLGVAEFSDKSAALFELRGAGEIELTSTSEVWIAPEEVSLPQIIRFPTRDGAYAYANFYPAKCKNSVLSALLVLVHGGPTSRADTSLSPLVQYFCQHGYAVLDVNHRGSTGRGRAYRQALLGQWGELDADDIADAIDYVVKHHKVDAKHVFIRGGSAGGYAVLRALTRFPNLFRGGACYYGIGNLIILAEITHKFEGHYTNQLIGEVYHPDKATQPGSRFVTRSPQFDIDKIQSPLIVFQGLEDKVVPPEISREMVETLRQNGVMHEYIEYPGEGHGFRQADTKIDALSREFAFYQKVLGCT